MRHHPHSSDITVRTSTPAADEPRYEAYRARVAHAHQRMQTISGCVHAPADARQAESELTAALREASTSAAQLLRQAQTPTAVPPRRWRHRHASRAAKPAADRWSSELVRLSEIADWLWRTTRDDLGVHLPTTVRVGTYAATGPHIAGLDFGTGDLAELHQPRIGVDLRAIIDRVDQDPTTGSGAAAVLAAAQAA